MIISIAWKNVWRNKTRSFIVICAVTLGTISGVFVAGLMKGWLDQRIDTVIYTEMGHLKIQNPAYLLNEEITHTLNNTDEIKKFLENSPEVSSFAFRSKLMAVATTARGSSGLILKGIDPEKEKQVSDVFTKIIDGSGSYFEKEAKLPSVLISQKTAEQLRIKNFKITNAVIDSLMKFGVPTEIIEKIHPLIDERFLTDKKFKSAIEGLLSANEIKKYGAILINESTYYQPKARITFSFTKANGELGNQTFQVCGIYKTANSMFDQTSAFVRIDDLAFAAELSVNEVHEASIILNQSDDNLINFQKTLASQFSDASIMNWKELAPDAGMMSDFMTIYYYMIMGIIFFALAFGIINTMLMAILERIKELGMLMAIGMKKAKVFQMIMLETIFLTLTGSVAGMILGGVLIKITGITGLNFSSVAEGFEAMGWAAVVYPSIETSFFIGVTIMVIVIAILSSIIPARKALKLKPVEALRIE